MNQSTTGERITAAISTLVAIALLGAAVTAQQGPAPRADRIASLESDLRFQLDMSARNDGAAFKARLVELADTLAAWRDSAQSPDDAQLLADWFEAAIDQTMPGSSGELPARPQFGAVPPLIVVAEPVVEEPSDAAPETPELADSSFGESLVVTVTEPPPAIVDEPAVAVEPLVVEEPAKEPIDQATDAATDIEPTASPEHSVTVLPTEPPADLAEPTTAQTPSDFAEAFQEPSGVEPPNSVAEEPAAVQVNLAELNARIGGYHQQLAEVEASMVVEGGVSPQRLAALVGDVEELAAQYQFVTMYYDSLSDAERLHVDTPRSMEDVLALAAGLAARDADAADFLADFDATDAAEPTLTERLNAVADAVGVTSDASR